MKIKSERRIFTLTGGVCGVGKDNVMKMLNYWGPPVRGELEKAFT